jgi:hypothetical protein
MSVQYSAEMKSGSAASLGALLLDSNLIAQTDKIEYNLKLIDCNGFVQIYTYKNKKINICTPFLKKRKKV